MKLLSGIEAVVVGAGFSWILLSWFQTVSHDAGCVLVTVLCIWKLALCVDVGRFFCSDEKSIYAIFRPGADPGFWSGLLLPVALMADSCNASDQDVYKRTMVEVYLLLLTINEPLNLCLGKTFFTSSDKAVNIIAVILWFSVFYDFTTAVCMLLFVFACGVLSEMLPWIFRKSFTQGESLVIMQLMTLMVWRIMQVMMSDQAVSSVSKATSFAVMSFLGVLSASILSPVARVRTKLLVFYLLYGVLGFAFVLPVLYVILGQNPFLWLLEYVMADIKRVLLFVWWTGWSVVSVVMVISQMSSVDGTRASTVVSVDGTQASTVMDGTRASTVVRKGFHVVAVAVCVPGILLDAECFLMSSVVGLGVLVILESIRFYQVPPLGGSIKSAYKVFLDDQDQGEIILTPLYLLLGCSLPVWISNNKLLSGSPLLLYAGVISLGVGDTMASVGGKMFGKHKWPGSKKTFEGTAIASVSMVTALLIFSILGVEDAVLTPQKILAIALTSLLEASTTQIDNLVLPLFMFGLLAVS